MINIYPFRALLPPPEMAHRIASPPYDVISTSEARGAAAGNPLSYLHVVRSEIDLPASMDAYDPAVYEKAAANLQSMVDQGLLVESSQPAIFIYRQVFQGRAQSGVVCCYDVNQYRSGEIKKHEKTRPDKEDDRTRHMTTCSAHAEPVFLTFRKSQRLEQLINAESGGKPIFDLTAEDGVQHSGWRVAQPESFVEAFKELDALYIADGHHRTAGAERAAAQRQQANPQHTGEEQYNRVMAVIFPANQLRILAYNRVVEDLNGLSESDFLQKLSELGSLEGTKRPVPTKAGQFCLRTAGGWHQLTIPRDAIDEGDPIGSLDVALLQDRVLAPLLGVDDPRTDSRITFVGGIRGTEELDKLVDSGKAVAFSMFPTRVEQLLAVSDAGKIMPPKSTWFEPKLRSGLFVHRFEPATS